MATALMGTGIADIAIVGAGPAGSSLAYLLSKAGRDVLLFAGRGERRKHCGGGIPARCLDEFPWIRSLAADFRPLSRISIVSPQGARCDIPLASPIRLYARDSFDGACRDMARAAGARLVPERVRAVEREGRGWRVKTDESEYRAAFLAGAGGVSGIVRRNLSRRFPRGALSLCAGWYLPPPDAGTIIVGFLERRSSYAWIFPRPGLASVGIVAPLAGADKKALLAELREWLARVYPAARFDYPDSYASLLPEFRKSTGGAAGPGWALVGDEAGVAEPVTREGIHFSLTSSEILAACILEERPDTYGERLAAWMGKAHSRSLFLRRWLFRPGLTERLIRRAGGKAPVREALGRFFSGSLSFDARLLRSLV